jgi:hypothetical protein
MQSKSLDIDLGVSRTTTAQQRIPREPKLHQDVRMGIDVSTTPGPAFRSAWRMPVPDLVRLLLDAGDSHRAARTSSGSTSAPSPSTTAQRDASIQWQEVKTPDDGREPTAPAVVKPRSSDDLARATDAYEVDVSPTARTGMRAPFTSAPCPSSGDDRSRDETAACPSAA